MKKILIIEDNTDINNMTAEALRRAGYACTQAFSKQEIYDYAWDDIYLGEDKTINVHISNIRRKLKAVTETEYIETWRGCLSAFTKPMPPEHTHSPGSDCPSRRDSRSAWAGRWRRMWKTDGLR